MSDYVVSKGDPKTKPKNGASPPAIVIAVVVIVILAVLVAVFMILYFRKNATLIKPSECPKKVTGLLVIPDKQINQLASNCGTQVDCTFQVDTLQEAVDKCTSFGTTKCASFTLKQVPLSDSFTMKISEATGTSVDVGSDTYQILE
jgi:hypothetical protein